MEPLPPLMHFQQGSSPIEDTPSGIPATVFEEYQNRQLGMMMNTLPTTQGRQLLPNFAPYERMTNLQPGALPLESLDPALQQPAHEQHQQLQHQQRQQQQQQQPSNPGQTNPTGYPQCVTANTNMLTKKWNVPSRAKPGRRRNEDPKGERRREQNRKAQRDFRARKADRVQELEQMLHDQNEQHTVHTHSLMQQIGAFRQRLQTLSHWCERQQQRGVPFQLQQHQQFQQFQHRLSGDSHQSSYDTSPTDSHRSTMFSPNEVSPTDSALTFYSSQTSPTESNTGGFSPSAGERRKGQPPAVEAHLRRLPDPAHNPRQSNSLDVMEIGFNPPVQRSTQNGNDGNEGNFPDDDKCGFCTDGANCVCFSQVEMGAAQSLLNIGNNNGSSSGFPGAGVSEQEHELGPSGQWQN